MRILLELKRCFHLNSPLFPYPATPPSHTGTSTVEVELSSNTSPWQHTPPLSLTHKVRHPRFFLFSFLAYYILALSAIKPDFFAFFIEVIIKASLLRVREFTNSGLPSPPPQFIEFYQVSLSALYYILSLGHMSILNLITVPITFVSLCAPQSLNFSKLCVVKKSLELLSWN